LYDNPFVAEWRRRGVIRESEATWEEVLEVEYRSAEGGLDQPPPNVIDIQGIGDKYSKGLAELGIITTDQLLKRGRTEKGLKEIASATEAKPAQVRQWVVMADLLRVARVTPQDARALAAAGVDSAAGLAGASSKKLAAQLAETGEPKSVGSHPVTSVRAGEWIAAARVLSRRDAAPAKGRGAAP
jgi:hypothetical protein